METKESVADWNRNRVQPGTAKENIAVAAIVLLEALDAHLYGTDYCGLEVLKRNTPIITDAIENLRAALGSAQDIDMDYEQRFAEASANYQQALRKVAETPPPTGQKFAPGARVKSANNLGPHMSHFPAGKLATVQYTYAHAYGSTDKRSLQQYRLDIDDIGGMSWYDECQLIEVPNVEVSSDHDK